MSLNQLLRRFLVRFPLIIKWANGILPAAVLRRLRTLAESIKYKDVSEVHELPEIFHYWSQKYVCPLLAELDYHGLQDFFVQHIERFAGQSNIRLLSIGAGNCELDLALVLHLKSLGCNNICYECLEINPQMIQRAAITASEMGLETLMVFTEQNIDDWDPAKEAPYQVIICRQFLHHVVELEAFMLKLKQAMAPGAQLLVDDMVGRNGHMRWPEALVIVDEFWAELPEQYKYHHLHGVTNKNYNNWDCSITGYEGIRAQDILPLLLEHFQFETFIAFANVIDVFVERSYGPNFSVECADDLEFIDRVQQRDQAAIDSGEIKPTHMIAALRLELVAETRCYRNITPEFAVRSSGT